MRNTITRIASFMLAFGLFIGCSTPSTTTNTGSAESSLSQKELKTELKQINEKLAGNGEDEAPETYYRKGYLLSELAQHKDAPQDRPPLYKEMRQALEKAEQLFRRSDLSSEVQKVDELLQIRWSNEHNQGLQITQKDSLALEEPEYEKAVAHYNNATIILPDSAVSYELKAQTQYRNRQLDEAIATLESARRHIEPLPSALLEQLAFLYLETDQPQKAVSVYEEAESFSEENLNVIHGLANAYIEVDNHQKALELLNMLVDAEPENIIYKQTRGTELYFLGAQKVSDIIEASNTQNNISPESFREVDSLFSEAKQQLTEALNSNPDNTELQQKLAYFYKNSAASYQRLLPYVPDGRVEQINKKIKTYLKASIPHFVALTEEYPDKKSLWRNLHQIYTYLDMDEKAAEIESNVN